VISALIHSIVDRFGMTYTVTRTRPWGTNAVAYYAPSRFSWRAQFVAEGCVSEALAYRKADRRRRTGSLYDLGEPRPLRPSRFRSEAGQALWASVDFGSGRSQTLPCSIMTDKARAHLQKVIDLLEPNVWLELDEVSFPRFFDGPLRRGSDALEAAKVFADQHGAVLIFLTNPRVAKFGRAYIKQDD